MVGDIEFHRLYSASCVCVRACVCVRVCGAARGARTLLRPRPFGRASPSGPRASALLGKSAPRRPDTGEVDSSSVDRPRH